MARPRDEASDRRALAMGWLVVAAVLALVSAFVFPAGLGMLAGAAVVAAGFALRRTRSRPAGPPEPTEPPRTPPPGSFGADVESDDPAWRAAALAAKEQALAEFAGAQPYWVGSDVTDALVVRSPSVSVPRSAVLDLDREFEASAGCRYGHHEFHVIIDRTRDGRILRECRVCAPPTRWTERA